MYPYLLAIYLNLSRQYGTLQETSIKWSRDLPKAIQEQYYSQFCSGINFEDKQKKQHSFNIEDFTKKVQAPISRFKLGLGT